MVCVEWLSSDIVLLIFYYHYFPTAINSSIIQRNSVHHQHLSRMLIEEGYDSSLWIPCYVALRHGWNVSSFHELCDNMAPTLTIVRKDNYIFGGFTENSWAGNYVRRPHLTRFLYIKQVHIVRLLPANTAVFPHSSLLENFRGSDVCDSAPKPLWWWLGFAMNLVNESWSAIVVEWHTKDGRSQRSNAMNLLQTVITCGVFSSLQEAFEFCSPSFTEDLKT